MRIQLSALAAVVAALLAMTAPAQAEPPLRTGQVVLFAGRGEAGFSGDGGPARGARITAERISAGRDGSVYLSDEERVRRVTPDGVIDTVYAARPDVDGLGEERLTAVAAGPGGSLYVTVDVDSERRLLRVGQGGAVTVLAGQRELGAASREGDGVDDVAVDGAGNAFLYDAANGRVVRVAPSGRVTRIGSGKVELIAAQVAVSLNGVVHLTQNGDLASRGGGSVYAIGATGPPRTVAATDTRPPSGPAVAADGTVYFIDRARGQIMRIDKDGSTVPVSARMEVVGEDLAVGPDGDLYVTYGQPSDGTSQILRLAQHGDGESGAPRKPGRSAWADDAPGTVHTVAGTGKRPPAAGEPSQRVREQDERAGGIAVDSKGTVYVAEPTRNQVRVIAPDGTTRRFAGTGLAGETDGDYAAEKADAVVLHRPTGVATAPDGTVYLTANQRLYRVDTAGKISMIDVGVTDIVDVPTLVATDAAGSLYYADYATIWKVRADGQPAVVVGHPPGTEPDDRRPARSFPLRDPRWLEVGADGSVYFVQRDGNAVRVARPNGTVDIVAGEETAGFAGDGGPATKGLTNHSLGGAVGRDGSRYIADTYNNRVRRIDARGTMTTVAGTGRFADTGDGGPATEAALAEPTGVDVGPDGTLFVLTSSGQVRAVEPNGTIRTLADLYPEPSRRATDTSFARLDSFAVGMDGTVYLAAATGLYSTERDGVLRPADLDPPLPTFAKYGPTIPPESGPMAMGPDGSLYLVPNALLRAYPDGAVVPLLGGGMDNRMADQPLENWSSPMEYTFREGDPQGIEIGPDGTVYLSTTGGLYSLSQDGKLDTLLKAEEYEYFGGIGFDPDGQPYLISNGGDVDRVVDGDTELIVSAAESLDPKFVVDLEDTADIAFTSDGAMFVSAGRQIHRFSPDGTDTIVHQSDKSAVTQLAVGPGDDLYFLEEDTRQVRVLVKAAQAPEESGLPISAATVVVSSMLVVLAGAFVLVWRVRNRPLKDAKGQTADTPDSAG